MSVLCSTTPISSAHDRTTWASLAQGETGDSTTLKGCVSVQLSGTFGGATVALQGSNDGINWNTLHASIETGDASLALSGLNAAGLWTLAETPYLIRPVVSGGDGSTSLKVVAVGQY